MKSNSVFMALYWKCIERFSVQGSQFVIQIILARLLTPDHYGALAIMMIAINVANVIIQNGFNTALIQNKDVNDEDFSSVFWLVLLMSCITYVGLYIFAPHLSELYKMPFLEKPFRVICLMLIPGSLNSVQLSIIRKSMDFKKEFTSNLLSIVLSGIFGIVCAFYGLGLWALVVQSLLNTVIACFTMWVVVGWRPSLVFNSKRVFILFSYGYKLVLAGLLETLYCNLTAFVIGAKYSASSLGFYARGNQFPNAMMAALNSAVQSVMLPALSKLQDDKEQAKQLMRKAMILSSFCIFPLMALLAGIAKPMVQLVLTDKWIPCVPYIQIFCFTYAFWPVHTSNLQAINAMGRSDIFLRLEICKKIIGWSALAYAVFYFDDPISIAATSIFMTIISCFINCYPNKYLLDYSYSEQMKDILPYFGIALLVFSLIISIEDIFDNNILTIMTQLTVAIVIYLSSTYTMRCIAWKIILDRFNVLKINK